MKTYALSVLASMFFMTHPSNAQFHAQAGASFFISPNALISIDGLSMQPTSSLTLSNVSLTRSSVPISSQTPNRRFIGRVYRFSTPVNFAGTLGFRFLDAELNETTEGTLQMATRDSDAQPFALAGNTSVDQPNNFLRATYANAVSLGQVTALGEVNSLPVTLVSFSVEAENLSAHLTWTTSSELNASHFEIEHSTKARNWATIGVVRSLHGNSALLRPYGFLHSTPVNDANYYRLRMVDFDGTAAYSEVRHLNFSGIKDTQIFPNPVKNTLTIRAANWEKVSQITVYNTQGITMYQSDGQPEPTINTKHFPPGTYVLRIQSDIAESYRFIVSP
jgi:hypothetical protein